MRLFEGLLLLTNLMLLLSFNRSSFKKIKASKWLSALSVIFFGLHVVVEKARWSMVPLYLVVAIALAVAQWCVVSKETSETFFNRLKFKRTLMAMMVFFVLTSGVLAVLFPVYKMPLPKGEYPIGTASFDITDPVNKAIYSDNLSDQRKIKVQIWYPAEATKGYKQMPWLEDGLTITHALAKDMALPSFALNQTALIMSHSFEKAPISQRLSHYPVVVISHGWTGFRHLHSDLAENLASNGYIVVGIDHTYGSEVTVFNDGDVKYMNKAALPSRDVTPNFLEFGNQLVNTYAADVNLTLNELEKFNSGQGASNFKDRLDLSKIGLLGHSTGGGADVSIAIKDKRIKALIGMDAWVEPIKTSEIEKGLKIPALFLRSGVWEVGLNNKNLLSLINKSSPAPTLYQLNGTTHYDFSMAYMYSPVTKYIGITGKLDGKTSASILTEMTQNFFDKTLKGSTKTSLSDVADQWRAVEFIR